MQIHGYVSRNYAAQINNTTVITKAFDRQNAIAYLRKNDKDLQDKDVYVYEGITGASTVDEVYCEPVRDWNDKGELVWKDVYKVRMKEEYADLV